MNACLCRIGEGLIQVPFAMDAATIAHSIPGELIPEVRYQHCCLLCTASQHLVTLFQETPEMESPDMTSKGVVPDKVLQCWKKAVALTLIDCWS